MAKERFEKWFSMDGKVVLITGGCRGLGLTIAETYAEAGADVALAARNLTGCKDAARNIERTFGVKAISKSMDVRYSKIVDTAVQEIADEFGRIDVLVNCAGIIGTKKPVMTMTDEDLDEVMNVNFRGTFLVSRAVAQVMVRQKSGKIINVSSIFGKMVTRNMMGYCASKAAVIQLTRVMALELMRHNIQVNALCPGYVMTDFNKGFFESETGKVVINKKIPINRAGEPDELKSLALCLATCPPFMTGSEIYIDGGHTIV
ncbi:MAG: SDR family NAD(P)-dependent oxidoreductase [Desulfomonilaceae bacterium]